MTNVDADQLSQERKDALIALMDDDSPVVSEALHEEFTRLGTTGILFLKDLAEKGSSPSSSFARVWLRRISGEDPVEIFSKFIYSFQYELETGCMLLERTVFPDFDTVKYYGILDSIAQRVQDLILQPAMAVDVCKVINRVLFHEYGFRGDNDDYYNPLNSYLHQVIQRKKGIPLSLSIIYILVAQRCGIHLDPIALPGHFMVACLQADQAFFIDPYYRGAIRSRSEVDDFLRERHIQPMEKYFSPTPVGEVLSRCCRNLANQYAHEHNKQRAEFFDRFVRAFHDAYRKHAES